MILLILFLGSCLLCLRLIGIQAEESGKTDWHWWLISAVAWFSTYFLMEKLVILMGINIGLQTSDGLELSLIGLFASILACYGLYKWLERGAVSDEDFDKIDEIGKDPK